MSIIRVVGDGFNHASAHIVTPGISEELSMQDSANGIIVAKGLSHQPHLSPSFGING